MSEPELRREAETCVDRLVRQGRGHLAQRLGVQLDRLIREHREQQAMAVIALFRPAGR